MTRPTGARFALPTLLAVLLAAGGPANSASAQPPAPVLQWTTFPIGRYSPGKWSALGIQAVNSSDQDGEGLLAVFFAGDTQTQYARRIWVPARSMRRTWLPVRVPPRLDPKRDSVEITALQLRETPQGEVMESPDAFDIRRTALLPVGRERIQTTMIVNRHTTDAAGQPVEHDRDAYEVAAQARQAVSYTRLIADLGDATLPHHAILWDNIDQLILCSNRIQDDSTGLAVVRDWLHRGGRLWVFLDRVTADTVAALVGNAVCYREAGRVPLESFEVEGVRQANGTSPRDKRKFESSVDLVRVLLTDEAEVAARVDGWPAAFWQRVGAGEILFVTLGASGWIPAPIPPSEVDRPEHVDADYRQAHVLRMLAERFYGPRGTEPHTVASLPPLLREQIGYRIPSRSLAAGLLGAQCLVLSLAGWWCLRSQRLDRLIWILPATALIATAAFVVIGQRNSRSVPPTVAFTQLVQVFPDTGAASVAGTAAFYQQETMPLEMTGAPDGFVRLASTSADGSVKRLIWGDDERGQWRNVKLAGGSVQTIDFQQPLLQGPPLGATAQFGPEGLAGRVSLTGSGALTDVVIAAPPALPLAVAVQPDGRFVAGRRQVLPAGQFLADRVLSDEGQRHQQLYRQLLDPTDDVGFPAEPTLFGWGPPVECGQDWPAGMRQAGSAVLAVPLQITRTPPGQAFEVPATFLRTELAAGAAGQSMTYNPRTGQWLQAAATATQSRLRFVLPRQVIPCQVRQATLTVKLNAPSRKLVVAAVVNGQDEPLHEVANPNGVHEFSLDQPEHLQLDAEGGLQLTISITESQQEREALARFQEGLKGRTRPSPSASAPQYESSVAQSFSTWQIDYVRLDVRGVTQ